MKHFFLFKTFYRSPMVNTIFSCKKHAPEYNTHPIFRRSHEGKKILPGIWVSIWGLGFRDLELCAGVQVTWWGLIQWTGAGAGATQQDLVQHAGLHYGFSHGLTPHTGLNWLAVSCQPNGVLSRGLEIWQLGSGDSANCYSSQRSSRNHDN